VIPLITSNTFKQMSGFVFFVLFVVPVVVLVLDLCHLLVLCTFSVCSMPPERQPRKGLPLVLSSTTRSLDERLRLLRPDTEVHSGSTSAPGSSCDQPAASRLGVVAGVETRALRADAPRLKFSRRGDATTAAQGIDDGLLPGMIQDLVADRVARSSLASSLSLLNTWTAFHDRIFAAEGIPVIPVSVRTLVAVSAVFKRGGYRSFANYLSAIRAHHVEYGFLWGQLLVHTGTWCTRSVLRGIGPARQSAPFHLQRLLALDVASAPLVTGGPAGAKAMALLASMFLLREVEVSLACISAWTFAPLDLELSWHLTSSKSDPLALGTTRTWGCLCGVDSLPCPYHVARSHLAWLSASGFSTADDSPLFPTTDGGFAAKTAVVSSFEALASLCLQPLHNANGERLMGGHTPRVTGAQVLAAHGVEVNKLRILARHSGDSILRYVADAPLKAIRKDLGLSSGSSSSSCVSPAHFSAKLSRLDNSLKALDAKTDTLASDMLGLVAGYLTSDGRVFVQNTTSAAIHVAKAQDTGHTLCGWHFATSRRKSSGPPFRMVDNLRSISWWMHCEKCLPTERELARSSQIDRENELSD
jgi:hypothetical protein